MQQCHHQKISDKEWLHEKVVITVDFCLVCMMGYQFFSGRLAWWAQKLRNGWYNKNMDCIANMAKICVVYWNREIKMYHIFYVLLYRRYTTIMEISVRGTTSSTPFPLPVVLVHTSIIAVIGAPCGQVVCVLVLGLLVPVPSTSIRNSEFRVLVHLYCTCYAVWMRCFTAQTHAYDSYSNVQYAGSVLPFFYWIQIRY